ncbi:hypothetical protein P7C73_g6049, partial [Tremellales sp. Uapishka_1]
PIYPQTPSLVGDALYFPHPSPPSHLSPAPPNGEAVWSATSLLAHQIAYYRALAESQHAPGTPLEPIHQAIVTVPAWWGQHQRKVYRDALELQGLTCLAMIGEGTAVGVNFAMTRSFPTYDPITGTGEREFHVIYDSGALSTTATVLAFYQTSVLPSPKSKTPINTTYVEVLGTGWTEIGGVQLDLAVQQLLLEDFIAKTQDEGIRNDKRAMAKLNKEANRVKHILSANQESNVAVSPLPLAVLDELLTNDQVESLYNDIDFRTRLSRTALESAISPSLSKFQIPLTDALHDAHLRLEDITSIILFGGNTRVPMVHQAVKSLLPENDDRIAQNVNTDEAAVLGAAYYGAGLSRLFKMKNKLEIVERSTADIYMNGTLIFEKGAKLGERKTMSFPAVDDFHLEFTLQGLPPNRKLLPFLSLQLLDIPTALANFSSPAPIVNVTLRLDSKGHFSTANAVLVSNGTVESGGMAGAIKGLFGKKEKEGEVEEGEEAPLSKVEKLALKFREKSLGIKSISGDEKRTTLARLTSVAEFETAKAAREEARNLLEGYLYRLSNLLSPDADNKALHEFATTSERESIKKLVGETMEWLGDEAERAEEKVLRKKRSDLETLERPVIVRFRETQTRGKAIEDFQQAMFAGRAFLIEAHKNHTEVEEAVKSAPEDKPAAPSKYTDDELKDVQKMLKDNEVWMDDLMKVQVTLEDDKAKDPVIFTKDLEERGKSLQAFVLRLLGKRQPRAPKPPPKSMASTTASAEVELETGVEDVEEEEERKEEVPVHEEL